MLRRALLAAGLTAPLAAGAQSLPDPWPDRPVRIIVPYAPGGPSDILARSLAAPLMETWHQPVVVENRPGAGSAIGTEVVARAAPNGTTLLLAATAHVINPALMPYLPFDSVRDFTAIINCASHPMVLVVHPATGITDMAGFIAAAKAQTGGLTMGSAGIGNASHLAMVLFASIAGIELTHVPFSGAAPAQAAILAGQVQGGFMNSTVAVPQIRDGTLRALAVADGHRWRELPAVPTLAELGYSGAEAGSWYGILAPARLPPAITTRLHQDILAALRLPAVRGRIIAAGLDPLETGPAEFKAQIAAETAKWAQVVKAAQIAPN
ncbi:MAG: tripartite tricarboxylate transporter substrate binding protein [Paracraurococcus sp.]